MAVFVYASQATNRSIAKLKAPVVQDVAVGVWRIMKGAGALDDPVSTQTTIRGLGLGETLLEWVLVYWDNIEVFSEVIVTYSQGMRLRVHMSVCRCLFFCSVLPLLSKFFMVMEHVHTYSRVRYIPMKVVIAGPETSGSWLFAG